ncbi:MAG: HEAT repeat domain-containing protein [Gammaproteobacteria bacterium]|nr:HEAT repeat domain-containing protein [Gammaproteobacteria bacterium]
MSVAKVKLFIAPDCPHCPNVLQALSELIKAGEIAELEVSNMLLVPEKAQALNIRSVPWINIGPFELTGSQTKGELQIWINRVESETGMQDYFSELLTTGELKKVIRVVKKDPELFRHFPQMMQNKETPLGTKIGIGAIFEEFQGSAAIQALIPILTKMLKSNDAHIRNDACYYLGLTESPDAIAAIQSLADDETEEVRETVHDALSIIMAKDHSRQDNSFADKSSEP